MRYLQFKTKLARSESQMQVEDIDKHLDALDVGSENLSKLADEPLLTDGIEELKLGEEIEDEIQKIPVKEKALVHDLV